MSTSLELGPFGQMIGVHTYNIKTLGFTTQDDAAQERAIESLTAAANKLVTHFPWLTGQVINSEASSTSSGTFKIVAYPPHEGAAKFIHVKDCKELLQPYQTILEAKAPLSMLDGRILSPGYGFPYMYPSAEKMPVFYAQINLLKGGILLTINAQHNVMDANADSRIIRCFAKLCAGGEVTPEELKLGNADRDEIFPSSNNGEELDKVEWFRVPSMLPFSPPWPPQYGNAPWHCFRIPASSITALKEMAKAAMPNDHSNDAYAAPYFSTDDILTALIWKHLVRSRSLSSAATSGLVRAVNGRSHFDPPVPAGYIGHAVTCVWTRVPLSELLSMPLPSVAFALRKNLIEYASPHHLQSLVHLLRTTDDKTTINYGAAMNMETDVMVTSHVAHGIYDADFGAQSGLGKPDVVRRPNLPDGRGWRTCCRGEGWECGCCGWVVGGDLKTLREGRVRRSGRGMLSILGEEADGGVVISGRA
ncbi:uncharacterized protein N0V89_009206 [Didymosphaeria variabile]|uniref:Trichothecene 3-O-acetyltransferase-like N-terminal domain-containing protein n=1 Tax=Didymosphaeria variabile TaxID=1932322 RepID=A0A9W8XCY4_9PLEO|nr:uncharacterized protein N0V89_009206 [Didymosphaeria variabile]KAJ4347836.1 hypothetical protein N0V89_009206 [Didymosphaeria variabile]